MRPMFGLPLIVLAAACGTGTIDLDEDTQRRCPAARIDTQSVSLDRVLFADDNTTTIEFRNGCTAKLGDLVLTFAIEGDGAFSVAEPSLTLAPGERGSIDVAFDTDQYGAVDATLMVTTNDPDVPTIAVPLRAVISDDQDQDGFSAVLAGGTDCDDFDAAVKPGSAEIWYDGVDQDCDGESDYDQDRDGYELAPRGADCDDQNADVSPDATELRNQGDDDCDGWIDEDFVRPNDIVITEIMADPVAVFDTDGEWFEIENTSDKIINIRNWTVTDYASDSFVIAEDMVIQPGDRRVFGLQKDGGRNGGAVVDYAYSRDDFDLGNAVDAVGLEVAGNTVTLVEYDVSWGVVPGASISLDPFFVDSNGATVGAFWCASESVMLGGDLGTPRSENDFCTSVDHDDDGVSIDDGDCDDTQGDIYPGAPESWNGIDDDCDGIEDNAAISSVRAGYVDGSSSDNLSHWNSLSTGDVDGDGDLELMIGTINQGAVREGLVYTLDGADAQSWSDAIELYDEAAIEGVGLYNNQGMMSPVQRDVTGDGKVDLVIGGSGRFTTENVAVAIYEGGSGISGSMDDGDALAVWQGGLTIDTTRVTSHLDMNGDGVAELLYGDPGLANGTTYASGRVYLLDADGATGKYSLEDDNVAYWAGTANSTNLGSAIDGADLDGDGYDDAVMCGQYASFVNINSGGCAVVSGDKSRPDGGGIDSEAKALIGGSSFTDRFGQVPTLGLGDFDGDSKLDLAIPARSSARVLIYFAVGDLDGTYDATDADVEVKAGTGPDFFGAALAVGDLNGDGADDLAVGAPDAQYIGGFGADEPGRVWVFSGDTIASKSSVSSGDAFGWVDGETVGDLFGWSLLVADVDGDGRDDMVTGAPNYSTGDGRVSIQLLD